MSELLTNEEMFHITSCIFVIGVLGMITVKIIAYIKLEYLSPIMQFLFFVVAIWSFFETIKYHQKTKNTTK